MSAHNLKTILVELLQQRHLLSAKDMLVEFTKSGRDFNKTSVYRALDQLETEGLICQQNFTDKQAVYELAEPHHAHLVCQICGSVQIAECDFKPPEKILDFKVDHHHVTLMGTCQICLKK